VAFHKFIHTHKDSKITTYTVYRSF